MIQSLSLCKKKHPQVMHRHVCLNYPFTPPTRISSHLAASHKVGVDAGLIMARREPVKTKPAAS